MDSALTTWYCGGTKAALGGTGVNTTGILYHRNSRVGVYVGPRTEKEIKGKGEGTLYHKDIFILYYTIRNLITICNIY